MRRLPALIAALVLVVLGASALPAYADDSPMPKAPASPGDPFGGQSVAPGPVIIITPGDAVTTLPPSSNPSAVASQIAHDQSTAAAGASSAPSPTPSPSATTAAVPTSTGTGSTTEAKTTGAPTAASSSDGGHPWVWWLVGIAVLLLAVGAVLLRRRQRVPDVAA